MSRVLFILVMVWLGCGAVKADVQTSYNLAYSAKAQQIADVILGEGKAVVSVEVSIENPTWSFDFSNNKDEAFMPGYSGIKNIESIPKKGVVSGLPVRIKRICVNICSETS